MILIVMLGWWYSRGWLSVLQMTEKNLQTISHIFAVKVLIRTLFSPWKQIYSPTNFGNFARNMADNAISRCIGAIVRGTILFWAGILSLLVLIFGLTCVVAWPFIPLLIIILPILTIAKVGV